MMPRDTKMVFLSQLRLLNKLLFWKKNFKLNQLNKMLKNLKQKNFSKISTKKHNQPPKKIKKQKIRKSNLIKHQPLSLKIKPKLMLYSLRLNPPLMPPKLHLIKQIPKHLISLKDFKTLLLLSKVQEKFYYSLNRLEMKIQTEVGKQPNK